MPVPGAEGVERFPELGSLRSDAAIDVEPFLQSADRGVVMAVQQHKRHQQQRQDEQHRQYEQAHRERPALPRREVKRKCSHQSSSVFCSPAGAGGASGLSGTAGISSVGGGCGGAV